MTIDDNPGKDSGRKFKRDKFMANLVKIENLLIAAIF